MEESQTHSGENKEHHTEHKKEHHGEHKTEHHKSHGPSHHVNHKKSDETIKISKLTIWKSISGILTVLLVIAIFTGGFGIGNGSDSNNKEAAQPRAAAPEPNAPAPLVVNMEDLMDDDAVKGDPNAPVTIVEFSDYECPFCARFYSQTLGQIDETYIKTGKVKLVYRDFPLGFHAQAQKAAEAAECAGEQDQYYDMHDKLFEDGVAGGVTAFKQYAQDIGLDTDAFNNCLDLGEMASEVQKDMQDGQAVGIQGTPGFIINGKVVSGAQPFAAFQQIIEAELQ